jgi:hypothetical protein
LLILALSLALPHSQSCLRPLCDAHNPVCTRQLREVEECCECDCFSTCRTYTPVAPFTHSAVFNFLHQRWPPLRLTIHLLPCSLLTVCQKLQPWQTPGVYHSTQPCRPKRSALAAKKPPPNHAAAAKTSHIARLSASKPIGLPTRSSAVRSRTSLSVLRLANAVWSLSFLARPSRASCGQPW